MPILTVRFLASSFVVNNQSFIYCLPRYLRKRILSLYILLFCNSVMMVCSSPFLVLILDEKSKLYMASFIDVGNSVSFFPRSSCGSNSNSEISNPFQADRNSFATLKSSSSYLNTTSYIGLVIYIL